MIFFFQQLQSFRYDKVDYEGLPFDFCGGYIGFIGYVVRCVHVCMYFLGRNFIFLSLETDVEPPYLFTCY